MVFTSQAWNKKTHCFNTWFQQKMSTDPKDDQRYGMVEAISHLVHRDYAEIGHLVGTHGMDGGFTNGNESMKIRY